MAHVLPLLKALAGSTRRGLPSIGSLFSNNFVLVAFLITYEHPQNYRYFHLLIGLILLFPLSLDPMRGLPRERLALLPLSPWDRFRLRLGSLFLSPVLWVAAGFLLFSGPRTRGMLWLVLAVPLLANAGATALDHLRPAGTGRGPRLGILPGRLGLLVQKNLRETFHLLDTYLAMILCALGVHAMRSQAGPQAGLDGLVTFLVVLALSTGAQQLFALDRETAQRYRLLPLRGWETLLAKNLAFLMVLMALVGFLAPLAGLVAGLGALAAGNLASTALAGPQQPWRLVRGASLGTSLAQLLLMAFGFAARTSLGPWALAPALGLWAGSLLLSGRWLDRHGLRSSFNR